jgi:beta-glucosidase
MTIMTSYNLINGVHAANCYDTITSFAREECGFEGYVMTDWYTSDDGVMDAFMDGESKYSPSSSATECIRTGNDLQMPGSPELVEQVANGVKTGAITKAMLQQCALRIIKVCAKCSCFDDAESYSKGMELKNFVVSK